VRFGYFLAETATNLKRNLLMTIAAISTVAISLLLLGGVQILSMIVNNVTLSWEARVEISAYLRDDASPGEIEALESQLSGYEEIQRVTYVSKEQAYADFKELYRNKPEFYEHIGPEDLPASLRVKLTDAKYTEEVAALIQDAPGVDDVRFGGEIIKRLLQVNSLLRSITLAMSIVLMVASAALIANTIRLAIYARREEISIMKLVGATNWFIRIPFMLEGVFAALVGALVASAIVVAANALLFTRMGDALPFLGPVFTFSGTEIASVLAVLVGVGTLVGVMGSSLALRRFLEV
jgi:cell division transport system permease protein